MSNADAQTQTRGKMSQSEYRVQGLSCANCARELQDSIRKLEHGQDASLLYNSSRLLISPSVDLDKVKKILKQDGASLVESSLPNAKAHHHDHQHEHAHNHSHAHAHDDGPHTHEHGGHENATNSHTHGNAESHGHSHDHSHGGSDKLIKWLLSISALLYLATFFVAATVSETILISMYLVSMVLSGYSTFIRGLRNLLKLKFNMDTLMTVAMVGAVLIGEWKEATLVAILFGVNELLEGYGMDRARKSMEALLDAAPKEAVLLTDGKEMVVPIHTLTQGNIVLVRSGEKIPSDGTIISGHSAVNEAAITGESLPVTKGEGDLVFGGSVNVDGLLQVRIDKAYEDSSLSQIMHLVQEAQDTKTPTELFIDKFAKYYTPAIMIIAALVTIIPPLLFGQPWMKWIYEGLAILIVGCPCSLVLSSPIALVSGMTRSARNGVLIKGGIHLEQLGKIKVIAFDKTGTLTKGTPKVMEEKIYDQQHFYRIAGAIEATSLHPLAKAVTQHITTTYQVLLPATEHLITLPGIGLQAEIEGTRYYAGSEDVLKEVNLTRDELAKVKAELAQLKAQTLTVVLIADDKHVLGMFGLADELRPESPAMIRALHEAGITKTIMLTGDHADSAKIIANKTGVSDWRAGLLPEQKVQAIKDLAKQSSVAMVGDGINDAPALAASNLGIAMGKGTDSAIETADIVLMQDHLGKLPGTIKIARKVNKIIGINIGFSLTLKLIAILLTIPGWLTLWIAVMSDMGATIVVTLLGLSILLGKDKE